MGDMRMSEEQFQAAIAAAARAGAEAALSTQAAQPVAAPTHAAPSPISVEEFPGQYASILKAMRERPAPPEPEPVMCVSPITGSTFRARLRLDGRVLELLDYAYPEGIDKHEGDGGRVPNGSPIYNANGKFDSHYLQWRWSEFWYADLRAWVGKRLPSGMVVTAPVAEVAAE